VLIRVRACSLNHSIFGYAKAYPGSTCRTSSAATWPVKSSKSASTSRLQTRTAVLVAPWHFCNHCAKCVAGLQNQCRQFTVIGNAVDGGNCELFAAPAANVIPIPDSLDFNEAASVPLVFVTAWHMLTDAPPSAPAKPCLCWARTQGGHRRHPDRKDVPGARDRDRGRRAQNGARPRSRRRFCHQPLSAEDFRGSSQNNHFEGVDIVIEHVGPATWEKSVRSLKIGGTLVTCGATTGPKVELDLRFLFSRQLSLLGSYMGTMSELHEVLGHVFAGRLKPVIDHTFPLKEIRTAHEYMEKSQMFGKIVLNP